MAKRRMRHSLVAAIVTAMARNRLTLVQGEAEIWAVVAGTANVTMQTLNCWTMTLLPLS